MTDTPETAKTDEADKAAKNKAWVTAGVGAAAIGSAAIVAALLYTRGAKDKKKG